MVRGIRFAYRTDSESILKLYGLDGRLVSSKLLEPGEKKVTWNPGIPTGVYFYKLPLGERTLSGKLLIL